MASTNTAFKVENGLLVVGNARVTANLQVDGDYVITGRAIGNHIPFGNTYTLGNTSNRWGAYLNSVNILEAAALANNLSVVGTITGNSTLSLLNGSIQANNGDLSVKNFTSTNGALSAVSYTVSGNGNVTGTFTANGATTINNTLAAGNTTITGSVSATTTASFGANTTIGTSKLAVDTVNARVKVNTAISDSNTSALYVTGDVGVTGTIRAAQMYVSNLYANVFSITGGTNTAIDTSTLFVDAGNNRVGINNTTPSDALSVGGSIKATANIVTDGSFHAEGLSTFSNNVQVDVANAGIRFYSGTANNLSYIQRNVTADGNTAFVFRTRTSNNDEGFEFRGSNTANGEYRTFWVGTAQTSNVLMVNTNVQVNSSAWANGTMANVVHAGNFGIFDSNGVRLGP